MKRKDLLIMSCLRQNARESLTRLSRKTSIPVSTIFDRLKCDADRLIQRHTCLIDFSRLGFSTRANIALRVDRKAREGLKEHLIKHQHVNSVYKINNGFDFMVEGVFRNIKEVEEFGEQLEEKFKIKQKQVYYIIEDIARERFLASPELLEVLVPQDSFI